MQLGDIVREIEAPAPVDVPAERVDDAPDEPARTVEDVPTETIPATHHGQAERQPA